MSEAERQIKGQGEVSIRVKNLEVMEKFFEDVVGLEGLGLKVVATEHAWLHMRSLYFVDPQENLLEFVCYDAGV